MARVPVTENYDLRLWDAERQRILLGWAGTDRTSMHTPRMIP